MNVVKPVLPNQWRQLVEESRSVRCRAHAPYSNFRVGASVLTGDGRIFAGCNIENASYSLTICAERVAACTAVSAGVRELDAVCVSLTGMAVPCGSCLQFLFEFNPRMLFLLDDLNREAAQLPECVMLSELLPRGFVLFPKSN